MLHANDVWATDFDADGVARAIAATQAYVQTAADPQVRKWSEVGPEEFAGKVSITSTATNMIRQAMGITKAQVRSVMPDSWNAARRAGALRYDPDLDYLYFPLLASNAPDGLFIEVALTANKFANSAGQMPYVTIWVGIPRDWHERRLAQACSQLDDTLVNDLHHRLWDHFGTSVVQKTAFGTYVKEELGLDYRRMGFSKIQDLIAYTCWADELDAGGQGSDELLMRPWREGGPSPAEERRVAPPEDAEHAVPAVPYALPAEDAARMAEKVAKTAAYADRPLSKVMARSVEGLRGEDFAERVWLDPGVRKVLEAQLGLDDDQIDLLFAVSWQAAIDTGALRADSAKGVLPCFPLAVPCQDPGGPLAEAVILRTQGTNGVPDYDFRVIYVQIPAELRRRRVESALPKIPDERLLQLRGDLVDKYGHSSVPIAEMALYARNALRFDCARYGIPNHADLLEALPWVSEVKPDDPERRVRVLGSAALVNDAGYQLTLAPAVTQGSWDIRLRATAMRAFARATARYQLQAPLDDTSLSFGDVSITDDALRSLGRRFPLAREGELRDLLAASYRIAREEGCLYGDEQKMHFPICRAGSPDNPIMATIEREGGSRRHAPYAASLVSVSVPKVPVGMGCAYDAARARLPERSMDLIAESARYARRLDKGEMDRHELPARVNLDGLGELGSKRLSTVLPGMEDPERNELAELSWQLARRRRLVLLEGEGNEASIAFPLCLVDSQHRFAELTMRRGQNGAWRVREVIDGGVSLDRLDVRSILAKHRLLTDLLETYGEGTAITAPYVLKALEEQGCDLVKLGYQDFRLSEFLLDTEFVVGIDDDVERPRNVLTSPELKRALESRSREAWAFALETCEDLVEAPGTDRLRRTRAARWHLLDVGSGEVPWQAMGYLDEHLGRAPLTRSASYAARNRPRLLGPREIAGAFAAVFGAASPEVEMVYVVGILAGIDAPRCLCELARIRASATSGEGVAQLCQSIRSDRRYGEALSQFGRAELNRYLCAVWRLMVSGRMEQALSMIDVARGHAQWESPMLANLETPARVVELCATGAGDDLGDEVLARIADTVRGDEVAGALLSGGPLTEDDRLRLAVKLLEDQTGHDRRAMVRCLRVDVDVRVRASLRALARMRISEGKGSVADWLSVLVALGVSETDLASDEWRVVHESAVRRNGGGEAEKTLAGVRGLLKSLVEEGSYQAGALLLDRMDEAGAATIARTLRLLDDLSLRGAGDDVAGLVVELCENVATLDEWRPLCTGALVDDIASGLALPRPDEDVLGRPALDRLVRLLESTIDERLEGDCGADEAARLLGAYAHVACCGGMHRVTAGLYVQLAHNHLLDPAQAYRWGLAEPVDDSQAPQQGFIAAFYEHGCDASSFERLCRLLAELLRRCGCRPRRESRTSDVASCVSGYLLDPSIDHNLRRLDDAAVAHDARLSLCTGLIMASRTSLEAGRAVCLRHMATTLPRGTGSPYGQNLFCTVMLKLFSGCLAELVEIEPSQAPTFVAAVTRYVRDNRGTFSTGDPDQGKTVISLANAVAGLGSLPNCGTQLDELRHELTRLALDKWPDIARSDRRLLRNVDDPNVLLELLFLQARALRFDMSGDDEYEYLLKLAEDLCARVGDERATRLVDWLGSLAYERDLAVRDAAAGLIEAGLGLGDAQAVPEALLDELAPRIPWEAEASLVRRFVEVFPEGCTEGLVDSVLGKMERPAHLVTIEDFSLVELLSDRVCDGHDSLADRHVRRCQVSGAAAIARLGIDGRGTEGLTGMHAALARFYDAHGATKEGAHVAFALVTQRWGSVVAAMASMPPADGQHSSSPRYERIVGHVMSPEFLETYRRRPHGLNRAILASYPSYDKRQQDRLDRWLVYLDPRSDWEDVARETLAARSRDRLGKRLQGVLRYYVIPEWLTLDASPVLRLAREKDSQEEHALRLELLLSSHDPWWVTLVFQEHLSRLGPGRRGGVKDAREVQRLYRSVREHDAFPPLARAYLDALIVTMGASEGVGLDGAARERLARELDAGVTDFPQLMINDVDKLVQVLRDEDSVIGFVCTSSDLVAYLKATGTGGMGANEAVASAKLLTVRITELWNNEPMASRLRSWEASAGAGDGAVEQDDDARMGYADARAALLAVSRIADVDAQTLAAAKAVLGSREWGANVLTASDAMERMSVAAQVCMVGAALFVAGKRDDPSSFPFRGIGKCLSLHRLIVGSAAYDEQACESATRLRVDVLESAARAALDALGSTLHDLAEGGIVPVDDRARNMGEFRDFLEEHLGEQSDKEPTTLTVARTVFLEWGCERCVELIRCMGDGSLIEARSLLSELWSRVDGPAGDGSVMAAVHAAQRLVSDVPLISVAIERDGGFDGNVYLLVRNEGTAYAGRIELRRVELVAHDKAGAEVLRSDCLSFGHEGMPALDELGRNEEEAFVLSAEDALPPQVESVDILVHLLMEWRGGKQRFWTESATNVSVASGLRKVSAGELFEVSAGNRSNPDTWTATLDVRENEWGQVGRDWYPEGVPSGSLLIYGSRGVGKTAFAQGLWKANEQRWDGLVPLFVSCRNTRDFVGMLSKIFSGLNGLAKEGRLVVADADAAGEGEVAKGAAKVGRPGKGRGKGKKHGKGRGKGKKHGKGRGRDARREAGSRGKGRGRKVGKSVSELTEGLTLSALDWEGSGKEFLKAERRKIRKLSRAIDPKRVLVIVDEAQRLLAADVASSPRAAIEALSDELRASNSYLPFTYCFVGCGEVVRLMSTHDDAMLDCFSASVLLKRFEGDRGVEVVRRLLGLPDNSAAAQRHPILGNLVLTDSAVRYLARITAGHARSIMEVANRLVQEARSQDGDTPFRSPRKTVIYAGDIAYLLRDSRSPGGRWAVAAEIMKHNFRELSDHEHVALEAMARRLNERHDGEVGVGGIAALSGEEIAALCRDNGLGDAGDVFRLLVERGILEVTGAAGYRFSSEMYRRCAERDALKRPSKGMVAVTDEDRKDDEVAPAGERGQGGGSAADRVGLVEAGPGGTQGGPSIHAQGSNVNVYIDNKVKTGVIAGGDVGTILVGDEALRAVFARGWAADSTNAGQDLLTRAAEEIRKSWQRVVSVSVAAEIRQSRQHVVSDSVAEERELEFERKLSSDLAEAVPETLGEVGGWLAANASLPRAVGIEDVKTDRLFARAAKLASSAGSAGEDAMAGATLDACQGLIRSMLVLWLFDRVDRQGDYAAAVTPASLAFERLWKGPLVDVIGRNHVAAQMTVTNGKIGKRGVRYPLSFPNAREGIRTKLPLGDILDMLRIQGDHPGAVGPDGRLVSTVLGLGDAQVRNRHVLAVACGLEAQKVEGYFEGFERVLRLRNESSHGGSAIVPRDQVLTAFALLASGVGPKTPDTVHRELLFETLGLGDRLMAES